MSRHVLLCIALLTPPLAGCEPARSSNSNRIEHGDHVDAGLGAPRDGGRIVMTDAWSAPRNDAWVQPGDDASSGTCPTYTANVQPLYRQHCATCHTTGSDAHFGSSYSIATSGSSSCRTSMASCTISLGRTGGSMARRDRLGGFNAADQAMIQSWITCGMPM